MNPTGKIRRKGVFLLPNALTTGALFAGFYSIIAGINGDYSAAAIAILVAGLFDGLDGRVARLTNTQSEFGVQYDSLSDMVSFGLAPALLAFTWSLQSMNTLSILAGKLGWLAAFVFVASAALRLARFNSQADHADRRYFQGLASPAAAGTLAVTIWFFADNDIAGESVRWLVWLVTVGLGLLMFSRVRYLSFKTMPIAEKVPAAWLFALVLLIVLLSIDPPIMMMAVAYVYVASGIVMTLAGLRNRQARRARRRFVSRRTPPSGSEGEEDREQP